MLLAVLEDNADRIDAMRRALKRESPATEWVVHGTAQEMIEWLAKNLKRATMISLDHDLVLPKERETEGIEAGSGRDVSNFLCTQVPCCPVLIHSSNSTAASDMRVELREAGWTCDRISPSQNLEWIDSSWIREVCKHLNGI